MVQCDAFGLFELKHVNDLAVYAAYTYNMLKPKTVGLAISPPLFYEHI